MYTYGAQGKLNAFSCGRGSSSGAGTSPRIFGVPQDFFGTSTTPVVEGDLLILNVGAPGGPEVAAFDKTDGRMVCGAGDLWGPSYATPVVRSIRGKRRLFVLAGGESSPPTGGLVSIDPLDGAMQFRFPWRSRSYESVNASCPVVADNKVLISASYRTGAALLSVESDGKLYQGVGEPGFRLALDHGTL